MNRKTAVITGVTGQDGAYLSGLLLEKGYRVVGISRRSSVDTTMRLSIIHVSNPKLTTVKNHPNFILEEGDVSDAHSMNGIITKYQPDEVYNLAAQSHVHTSFAQPGYTWGVNANGCLFLLEAIRNYCPTARFYQASTSEMFGINFTTADPPVDSTAPPILYQDEDTAFEPNSPYAVAKLAAHHTVQTYRRAYGMHASCGILFNHESEIRGENFVTRKITKWLAGLVIKQPMHNDVFNCPFPLQYNEEDKIRLGNIDARRDWGHARDYVRAMWLMLQQDEPDDYVIATGETRSVLDFVCAAFRAVGWNDDPEVVRSYIDIDPKFYRPADVEYLLGSPKKAKEKLGWEPLMSFDELVARMVKHDIEVASGLQSN